MYSYNIYHLLNITSDINLYLDYFKSLDMDASYKIFLLTKFKFKPNKASAIILGRKWYAYPSNGVLIQEDNFKVNIILKGLDEYKTFILTNFNLLPPVIKPFYKTKILEIMNNISFIKYLFLNYLLLYGGAISLRDEGIAVLGMSGIGKTTFLKKLLTRFSTIKYLGDDVFLLDKKMKLYPYPTMNYSFFKEKIPIKLPYIKYVFYLEHHCHDLHLQYLDSESALKKISSIQNIRFPITNGDWMHIFSYVFDNKEFSFEKILRLRNAFLERIINHTENYIIRYRSVDEIVSKFWDILDKVTKK